MDANALILLIIIRIRFFDMYYLNLLKYRLSLKHLKHNKNVIALKFFVFLNEFFSYSSIILLSLFFFNIFKLFMFQHATHSEPATSKMKNKRKEEARLITSGRMYKNLCYGLDCCVGI